MAEVEMSRSKRQQTGLKKRVIRIDLTPMVDLGFLLITFFVFTNSMSESKVMNFNQSADGTFREAPETGALTILTGDNGRIFYYHGFFKIEKVKAVTLKQLRNVITEQRKTTPLPKLMVIIKTSEVARFGDVINIMDEMSIADIPAGHYTEDELTDEESIALKIL